MIQRKRTSSSPSRALVAKKLPRPRRAHWEQATTDQRQICVGIQRSGPTFLDTSCEGSSASRNDTRKTVFP